MRAPEIALVYLARGAEPDHLDRFARFIRSYARLDAGIDHRLYVAYKGYDDQPALRLAQDRFAAFDQRPLLLEDDSFDIGAYAAAATLVSEPVVCFLNSNSEIVADAWLRKMFLCLDAEGIGIVGASGSYESLGLSRGVPFPPAPNVHLRSNAFMMGTELAVEILSGFVIRDKIDAFMAESGPDSITRQVYRRGLAARVVGRDGRGFSPPFWPTSRTFRSGDQSNILVEDNLSREFDGIDPPGKREALRAAWGRYRDPRCILRYPACGPADLAPSRG
jgi:hypothetical protein